ncbi:MAG: hypothetical protein JWL61_5298 [Gemmatimonadetes bacterium]|nr:hypothetical protein [Gemmatimonadota bacterium]
MKPIADLPAERAASHRTRWEVQEYTAHHTIRAAQRAVRNGTDDEFDRDLVVTLAMVQDEGRQSNTTL